MQKTDVRNAMRTKMNNVVKQKTVMISGVAVRVDGHGRYCMNDLHKAAGGEEKSRPNQFLRIDQTVALIAEIETAQMCAVKTTAGRNGGTYAVKELVYAYARTMLLNRNR